MNTENKKRILSILLDRSKHNDFSSLPEAEKQNMRVAHVISLRAKAVSGDREAQAELASIAMGNPEMRALIGKM